MHPDYDYEYEAQELPLHLDEKGRKFVMEVPEEIRMDAEDKEDEEKLEEATRQDEAQKEKVFGPMV